jgi:hypothetical protein
MLYLWGAADWRDHYAYAIGDYLSAMAIVLLLQGWAVWQGHNGQAARWIGAGIGVSGLAVAVQSTGVAIGAYVNHNDIYHFIQMLGLYLLYRGAVQLKDR